MQQPQFLTYGVEGRTGERLAELATAHRLWLREVRQLSACRNLLRAGNPGILVLRLGRDLEGELSLLAEVGQLFPETATIVVGDTDNPPLAGLAWDLGAHYVLFPPTPIEVLPDVVRRCLADAPHG